MAQLSSGVVGIDQGDATLFSDVETQGEMWTGSGDREARLNIVFSEPFRAPPAVHLTMSLFDMDRETNARGELVAENIDSEGFDAVFRTWGDTRIARLRVRWLAIGPIASEDDWDIG